MELRWFSGLSINLVQDIIKITTNNKRPNNRRAREKSEKNIQKQRKYEMLSWDVISWFAGLL